MLIAQPKPIQDKRTREKELLALMLLMATGLDAIAVRIARDEVGAKEGLQEAQALLFRSHQHAAQIGGNNPNRSLNISILHGIATEQTRFAAGFVRDLEAGRYSAKAEGGEGMAARRQRVALYANRLVGTANWGWLASYDSSGQSVRWILGENEDHCKDCLAESKIGWRSPALLTRVPGDGRTLCIVNCKCHLETADGATSFSVPDQSVFA